MLQRFFTLVCVCLSLSLIEPRAAGQGAGGSFTGTVEDSSGAVIPRATITATGIDSGRTWSTSSNELGIYNIPSLPPAAYRLAVEAQGFKRLLTNTIVLEINQVARVDRTLEVGAVAETVEVKDIAPVLQTENTQLGSVISGNTSTNLPLNGRNFAQLTLLAPGVVTYNVFGFCRWKPRRRSAAGERQPRAGQQLPFRRRGRE